VRTARVFQRLLGVEHTTVVSVELVVEDGEEVLVARVRPHQRQRSRCSRCRRRFRAITPGRVVAAGAALTWAR
jgi:hypothetical protein